MGLKDLLSGRGRQEQRRARGAEAAGPGALRDFLQAAPVPQETPVTELPLLALDFETTGLEAASAQVLSLGMVPVDGPVISLAGAAHLLIRSEAEVGQSATIHGITDDDLLTGAEVREAVDVVLAALTGRVLLAHYAALETSFLSRLVCEVYPTYADAGRTPTGKMPRLPVQVVDTMALQRRRHANEFHTDPPEGSLRLWAARDVFGLPPSRAHDALSDALACAELYLAQTAEWSDRRGDRHPLTLKDLL